MQKRTVVATWVAAVALALAGCAGKESADVKASGDAVEVQTENTTMKVEGSGKTEVKTDGMSVETDEHGNVKMTGGEGSVEVDDKGNVKVKGAAGNVTVDSKGGLVKVEGSGH